MATRSISTLPQFLIKSYVNATSQNIWPHSALKTATTVLCKSDSMGQKFFNEWHPNSMVISKDRSEWQPKVQRPTWWRVNWKWSAEALNDLLNDFSSIRNQLQKSKYLVKMNGTIFSVVLMFYQIESSKTYICTYNLHTWWTESDLLRP